MTVKNKKELIKKIAAVIILGLLFCFVRMFYQKPSTEKQVLSTQPVQKVEIPAAKPLSEIKKETKFQKLHSPSYIKSSDKSQLIKLASQNIGKNDPFVNTSLKPKTLPAVGTVLPTTNNLNLSILPPSPGDLSNLPDIQAIIPDNEPVLKGFIGNKAIISYKGINRAVFKNQTFEDIKITSIMADNLSIEYIQKGKKHFKQLKLPDNTDLNIIR